VQNIHSPVTLQINSFLKRRWKHDTKLFISLQSTSNSLQLFSSSETWNKVSLSV
jgi:hypothetical protein